MLSQPYEDRHARFVAKRQSGPVTHVDPTPEHERRAQVVGERIRAAMVKLGWVYADGRPDVGQLAEAIGAKRWQTVQFWIDGENAPRMPYAQQVADALGMTLNELMGMAPAPNPPGWEEFIATDLGRSLTPAESLELRAVRWPHGPPNAETLASLLLLFRSRKPAS
jgi:hypothetical protein